MMLTGFKSVECSSSWRRCCWNERRLWKLPRVNLVRTFVTSLSIASHGRHSLSPSKVTVCFQNNRADHFSRLQRRIPLSVWSQPVNQEVIGSFQPLVRPWLRLHWMGEVRKRSKTSAFFSSGLIIDYRLGSRIHFASQQRDEERFSVLLLLLFRSAGTSFIEQFRFPNGAYYNEQFRHLCVF